MIKKITVRWLKSKKACIEGIELFKSQKENNPIKCLEKLICLRKYNDASWLITRLMNYKQRVEYAVFAADQVIEIFEKEYPGDDRPRKAIEAAKKCMKNPSKKNKAANAADAVADAAIVAADAVRDCTAGANAAYAAVVAADYAVAVATGGAYADAYAANAAAAAAAGAANAANAAADYAAADYAAANSMKKKILLNGIRILEDSNE